MEMGDLPVVHASRALPILAAALGLAPLGCVTGVSAERASGSAAALESAGASGDRFDDDDDSFRRWFAFYYLQPEPARLTAAFRYMDGHGYLESYPDIASIFVSEALRAAETAAPGAVERIASEWTAAEPPLTPKAWNVILVSLWLVDSPAAHKLAEAALPAVEAKEHDRFAAMLKRDPKGLALLSYEIVDPRQINMLWAAFSASGDRRYVDKVIDYVNLYGDEENPLRAKVGEVAIMTLATNALQHPRVAKLCGQANVDHPDPRTRALLGAMINALAQMSDGEDEDTAPAH
jgi:hypothetical protein